MVFNEEQASVLKDAKKFGLLNGAPGGIGDINLDLMVALGKMNKEWAKLIRAINNFLRTQPNAVFNGNSISCTLWEKQGIFLFFFVCVLNYKHMFCFGVVYS